MVGVTIVHLLGNRGDRIPFKVADASAIAKNAVCELTDPFTVISQTNANTPIAGISAHEKVANDGAVWISVITNAVIKCTVKTAVTVGLAVSMDADDGTIDNSTGTDLENGINLGWALETGTAAETVLVRMRK